MRCPAACRRWLRATSDAKQDSEPVVKSPCRICLSIQETCDDPLVAPCRCDGSLRYVHNGCQQAWLKARRTPHDYRCELCHVSLAWRLTAATRFELLTMATTSAVVWFAQANSVSRCVRFAARMISAFWRHGAGRRSASGMAGIALRGAAAAKILPSPSNQGPAPLLAGCEALTQGAVMQLAAATISILVAHHLLASLRRPLVLFGEDMLSRLCVVKIGGCVLIFLHELLWAFPPAQRGSPLLAWRLVGSTLLLDTFLLAYLRVPREERCHPGVRLRVLRTACRLTGDFLPFAAVFFLWTASVVMIVVASVMPCAVLLFHEAARDLRRRRQRHGSLQLAVLVARLAARLAAACCAAGAAAQDGPSPLAAAARSWSRIDSVVASVWLVVEVFVLLDLGARRRGVSCANDAASQVMWALAVLGQALLAVFDRLNAAGWLVSHQGSSCMRGESPFDRFGRAIGAKDAPVSSGLTGLVQEAALLAMLAAYLAIHGPVFADWVRRTKQAVVRAVTHIEPDQVMFCDSWQHRSD